MPQHRPTLPSRPSSPPAEVAALFRVDPKSVTRWTKQGRLACIRTIGDHRRHDEAQVRALLGRSQAGEGQYAGSAA